MPPITKRDEAFDALSDSAFVKLSVVCEQLGISKTTYVRRAEGRQLPEPKNGRINVGEFRRALLPVSSNPRKITEQGFVHNCRLEDFRCVKGESDFVFRGDEAWVPANILNSWFRIHEWPSIDEERVTPAMYIRKCFPRLSRAEATLFMKEKRDD